jgi:hypothetical protein
MALRQAATGTVTLPLSGEGDDTLTVRAGISKGDFNKLLKALPADYDAEAGFTPGQAGDFTAALFAAFVTGWTSDLPLTVDSYLSLEVDSAASVDEALLTYFNSLSPSAAERKSGEGDSA